MNRLTGLASKILSAFRSRDQRALRKLNDAVLKETAMECEKPCFNMAVFSYVLSKIVSKPRFLRPEYRNGLDSIGKVLSRLVERLPSADETELDTIFEQLQRSIERLEEKDPRFVVDLVTKGKLKMAATFYAQGMSLGVAAEMTGLEKQEILDYAGETMMFDRLKSEKSITERMKVARKFLS
ncbi:MAG: hypothetical protein AB1295_04980 [Candidatus Micrarchaeota archaeon]